MADAVSQPESESGPTNPYAAPRSSFEPSDRSDGVGRPEQAPPMTAIDRMFIGIALVGIAGVGLAWGLLIVVILYE